MKTSEEAKQNLLNLIEAEKVMLVREGIEPPNSTAIDLTLQVIDALGQSNILPERIATSCEGGLCLMFTQGNKHLYLEIYNDSEMGYIIEDFSAKVSLENEDVVSVDNIVKRVVLFCKD